MKELQKFFGTVRPGVVVYGKKIGCDPAPIEKIWLLEPNQFPRSGSVSFTSHSLKVSGFHSKRMPTAFPLKADTHQTQALIEHFAMRPMNGLGTVRPVVYEIIHAILERKDIVDWPTLAAQVVDFGYQTQDMTKPLGLFTGNMFCFARSRLFSQRLPMILEFIRPNGKLEWELLFYCPEEDGFEVR